MNKIIFILTITIFVTFIEGSPDLKLGAGGFGYGCGSNAPHAQLPFSFLRLGPDTTPSRKSQYMSFQHFGGYSDGDHSIRAFSHMHLVGAGVQDMGVLGILPTLSPKKNPKIPNDPLETFFKSTEFAEPGYYTSTLIHNTKVELTTTQRCGAHRYNFNEGSHDILIMPSFLLQKKAERHSNISICGQKCLEGDIDIKGSFGGRFGGYRIHYSLFWQTDTKDTVFIYNDTEISDKMTSGSGNFSGAIVRSKASKMEIYVGLSYVSRKNAKLNLETQVGIRRFDQILNSAKQIWKNQLNRFQITAISQSLQTQIDTAIYRTLLTPTLFNDVNKQYPSFANDGTISKVPNYMQAVYTDMSLWDVHRTQMPWLLFQDLERFNDIAYSLVIINREGGYMPKWPFAQGPTGCMIGSHANTILSDWIVKQAQYNPEINKTQIFEFMLRNANTQTIHDSRPKPSEYIKNGYITFQTQSRSSCSQTLELSYNDFGISQVAKILGDDKNTQQFLKRSKFYKNLWNNQTKFFQPKYLNGTFFKITPKQRINIFSNYYVEGDAWHYRFYAPHDVQGLASLFQGPQNLVHQLEKFFNLSVFWPTLWLPNPYYWAGNEHDLFSVWIFGLVGRPDLTQKYSRMIINKSYSNTPQGLPGNDDYATMSAWLIFASLGFYPLPSTTTYILGSPLIHQARIIRKMPKGKRSSFLINVRNNSVKNYKVQEVSIKGQKLLNTVDHKDLISSNVIVQFLMKK